MVLQRLPGTRAPPEMPNSNNTNKGNSEPEDDFATVPAKRARYSLSSSSSTDDGDASLDQAIGAPFKTNTENDSSADDQFFLPCTVLKKIFEYLPESNLLNEVQFVNKHWHHVANTSSACFSTKMFRLDKLLAGSKSKHYEYMCNYLSRYGKFLKKLTISMNGRTINRDQTLHFVTRLDSLFSEQNLRFYHLKKLSLSNLRLERRPWKDRRPEMTELFIKILRENVPRSLERLWVHDVLLEPQAAVKLIQVLEERLYGLQELDLEELVSTREPDRELDAIIIEQETGELIEGPPGDSAEAVQEIREFREARESGVPVALGRFLRKAAKLRKLILNYTYLTAPLVDSLLDKSPDNKFGTSLTDFHIRVDHIRTPRIVHDNFDQTNPHHLNPPTLCQFRRLTHAFPNIRFSISFEREMRYSKHRQVMGDDATSTAAPFRLHRLELRGDAFSDTDGQEPSLSSTLIRIVPKYAQFLNKLVLDWYNPVEFLDAELFGVVKCCQALTVLKLKLFMEFRVVKDLLNLIRFCEDLDQEQIVEFEDFPECIPNDMTTLPRKLKVLRIVRYCFEENDFEEGMVEDDPDWQEWQEHNYIENEYQIAVERLKERGEFEYQRTVAY